MGLTKDQLVLVQHAVCGRDNAVQILAESIQPQLRSYVVRITLDEDLTNDIVQETTLEMFESIHQLKEFNRFWPWLYKIALNKTKGYFRTQAYQKKFLHEHAREIAGKKPDMDGFANAYQEEFKKTILEAISSLSGRQKAVLSMRCYEKMSYSQIAEIMGVSELGCRLLLARAKKQLQKRLFRLGFGKESLLVGLVLFGKLTAPSQAAAAQISVTSATLSCGGLATGISLITGKTALTVVAGTAVVTGVWTTTTALKSQDNINGSAPYGNAVTAHVDHSHTARLSEGYYFFPQGKHGPVMTRLTVCQGNDKSIQILQNGDGNYYYDPQYQSVSIRNHHYWHPDLSVMKLPTDSPELEAFLAQVENRPSRMRPLVTDAANLLFVSTYEQDSDKITFGIRHYDALMEERFQYNRPARAAVIDARDALHQQKGCTFILEGRLNGRAFNGKGYIPFVYGIMAQQPAWLELRCEDGKTLLDTASGAVLLNSDGTPRAVYPAGTFMTGLNRPWQGLHTIDTVRRDAALYRMPFETRMESADKAQVTLLSAQIQITYTVHMTQDWIETITFADAQGQHLGELRFSYGNPQSLGITPSQGPSVSVKSGVMNSFGKHWLSELGMGILFD